MDNPLRTIRNTNGIMLLQIFFLNLLMVAADRIHSSGFYVDNGLDQTVRERLLSPHEQRDMQNEILNLLGLPARPPTNQHTFNHSQKIDKKGSAPKFLLDIYRSLLNEQDAKQKSEFELSGEDLHAIHESDVIMSFVSRNAPKGALRHQKGHRFWFDVSEVPVGETIVAAELRVFRKHPETKKSHKEKYSIMLSQLIQKPEGEYLKKLVELPIDGSHEGWLLFNVTGPLTDWVTNPDTNLGLLLSVTHHHTGHDVKPEEADLVTAHSKNTEKQPFMVAFFKSSSHAIHPLLSVSARAAVTLDSDGDGEESNDLEADMLRVAQKQKVHSRSRRDTRRKKKTADMSHVPSDSSHYKNIFTEPVTSSHQWSGTSCQMKTMYVSFADLGWKDWIIAPEGYPAYYCAGECNFPLTSHMNATNHAIVQTLVHLMKPRTVPKPCCAPLRLTGISVLYYVDASANVILKQYKNMVVKSCGCH